MANNFHIFIKNEKKKGKITKFLTERNIPFTGKKDEGGYGNSVFRIDLSLTGKQISVLTSTKEFKRFKVSLLTS